ncbi:MAG: type I-E CRISPR-associated protein Cas5/CasD [Candidatus Binatia bacterium]
MIDALVLRFDAPLLSFGGVAIDSLGVTRWFPGRAMLAGLLGNALGYTHGNADKLQALQARIRYAARCERPGREIVDYQTVDLGQEFLKQGWTTRGTIEGREGGTAKEGTHIRYRHYLADAVYVVALTLTRVDDSPTLDEVGAALREPARPLFIGRKSCLPAAPLLVGRTRTETLLQTLEIVPRGPRANTSGPLSAWWPADEDTERPGARLIPVTDDRDWTNQIHVGRRWMHEGTING